MVFPTQTPVHARTHYLGLVGVSNRPVPGTEGMIRAMAQPWKGPRDQLKCRVHSDVYLALRCMAAERGLFVTDVAADLLAQALGRPDLVRYLGEQNGPTEELPLAM